MSDDLQMNEIHWLMDMFNTVDVGLVVLDKNYQVCVWNGFMENHSGLLPSAVKEKNIFNLFPSIDEKWFKSKADPVFVLKNRTFTIWEQQAYIFRFKNYRPITGKADFMYQNATFIPLTNMRGEVEHICIIIYDVTDVAVNKKELKELNHQLETMSQTDSLTQLSTRGHWEAELRQEFLRIRRNSGHSSLIIFDIDYFKKINDEYGHGCGDEALRQLSQLLKTTLRETDTAGRYGGEEFVITLLDTDSVGAAIFAERLRALVAQTPINYKGIEVNLTISIGFACVCRNFSDHERWIEAADKALYYSKNNGRNKVTDYNELIKNDA
ncbi:diguanylate cyclase [Pseudoalteromonas sp. MMG010]|uniref:sensor domain-containing diguanylate cyclase n=1 Tax=Pseudoalteromonas sp. MMG010 TaxID=2822685 RepID=UPI001B3A55B5|nr:diguanylate cyclase [Pseudoalteromonas sp. MMG010]MBQ4833241.1 diguanylate cyclase [Pseudoalteromonas sp. MMG010]